jgi:hypothetical protein
MDRSPLTTQWYVGVRAQPGVKRGIDMWIETDHHGMINLDYVKRIDLAGDMSKKSLGVYLFDVSGDTYTIVDIPRFKNIGILHGNETEQNVQLAVYTFYAVTKRLIGDSKNRGVITIEAIYKEFAQEWYAQQKKETAAKTHRTKTKEQRAAQAGPGSSSGESTVAPPVEVHHFSDMKQFLDAYSRSYLLKFSKKPSLRYANEGKIARELVKLYPLEKLKTMLQWYFESDEDFITKAQYDIKTFRAILEKTRDVGASQE